MVRLYLPYEHPPQDHSRAQVRSARENGCSVGGYMWLYRGARAGQDVADVLTLARSVDLELDTLWIDVEPYTDGSVPTVAEIVTACEVARAAGVQPGIYTGKWVWDRYYQGVTEFAEAGVLLWTADYSPQYVGGALDRVPLYGGWTRGQVRAHQWTSSPVDRNVFLITVAPPDSP